MARTVSGGSKTLPMAPARRLYFLNATLCVLRPTTVATRGWVPCSMELETVPPVTDTTHSLGLRVWTVPRSRGARANSGSCFHRILQARQPAQEVVIHYICSQATQESLWPRWSMEALERSMSI